VISKARLRDIPFSEIQKCMTPIGVAATQPWQAEWERMRGQEIEIETPPYAHPQNQYVKCGGPFYQVHGRRALVCPHIAEIALKPEPKRKRRAA
jgi:hypothetical protein